MCWWLGLEAADPLLFLYKWRSQDLLFGCLHVPGLDCRQIADALCVHLVDDLVGLLVKEAIGRIVLVMEYIVLLLPLFSRECPQFCY